MRSEIYCLNFKLGYQCEKAAESLSSDRKDECTVKVFENLLKDIDLSLFEFERITNLLDHYYCSFTGIQEGLEVVQDRKLVRFNVSKIKKPRLFDT